MNRTGCAVLILLLGGFASARAGDPARDATRLREALSPSLAVRVLAIVERARANGLPTDPLVGRALEGNSRQASDLEIVEAVTRQAAALAESRSALGDTAPANDLEAAAGALMAGVPRDSLTRLHGARPESSLVVPLIVMSDLVARGVPVEIASKNVIAAVRVGATDRALMRMRERVHDRIRGGASPGGAARDGLRELLRREGRAPLPETRR